MSHSVLLLAGPDFSKLLFQQLHSQTARGGYGLTPRWASPHTDEYHHHHHTALDKTGNLSLLVARTDYVDVLCWGGRGQVRQGQPRHPNCSTVQLADLSCRGVCSLECTLAVRCTVQSLHLHPPPACSLQDQRIIITLHHWPHHERGADHLQPSLRFCWVVLQGREMGEILNITRGLFLAPLWLAENTFFLRNYRIIFRS